MDDDGYFPWLGGRRFWAGIVGFALVCGIVLLILRSRASDPNALVPNASLSGPTQALAGESVRYAVLVRDRFGAPIEGADVKVGFIKSGFYELGRARTSDGGEAAVEVRFPSDFAEPRTLLAIASAGVAEDMDALTVTPKNAGKGSVYVSTDKPLYQPGQTIHVRALAMAGERPVADKNALVEVRTEDGIKVFREEKRSSAFGLVASDFVLADQVKLGKYRITVKIGEVNGDRQVDVKRYALPKLKIEIEDHVPLAPGAVFTGRTRAKWIFGEPVTRGTATVTLERGTAVERKVTGAVDKDGAFTFSLPASSARGTFTLRARIDVEGGIHAESTASVATLGEAIKLEAFPESGVLARGIDSTVYVVATSSDHEGLSIQQGDKGPVAKTNAEGIARVTVHPPSDGSDTVMLRAKGPLGAEGRVELKAFENRLVVRPDRAAYHAGDTAHVVVLGAAPGDRVTLRISKGEEPIARGACVVEPSAACNATIEMPKDVSGLAWIHALSLPTGKREPTSGKRLVIVGGGGRDLDLKVTPDKPSYQPRETGHIDVRVGGNGGAAVKAELGATVADEAVFALADVRPDLEKQFFTTDKDLEGARKAQTYNDWRRRSADAPPESETSRWETRAAFDAASDETVRETILAALTSMPAAGAFGDQTKATLADHGADVVRQRLRRLGGWAELLVAGLALVLFLGFDLYVIAWLRRRASTLPPADGSRVLLLETRALLFDMLVAVPGPFVLAAFGLAATSVLTDRSISEKSQIVGTWSMLAVLGTVLFARAVVRARRTPGIEERPMLRRVLGFLPIATFLGHLALLLFFGDEGGRVSDFVDVRQDVFFLPLLVVLVCQLTFGLLVTIRQTLLSAVSTRRRVWLVLSRASFVGLPVTLFFAVLLGRLHWIAKHQSWVEYEQEERPVERIDNNADNKEGGTGTRAKGEEGSMGNPNTVTTKRWGAPSSDEKQRGEPIRVRDYFPETLLWAPSIVTGDDGHATIAVPFADSITTWRFGLRAVSREGQLGSTTIPLVVKQDFFVDATLPATLTQGDELAVPVTVYSYAAADQDVTIDLSGDGFEAIGSSHAALRLAPREARGLRFTVRATKAGDRLVRVVARSPVRDDAQERKVTVVPNGVQVVRTRNGHMTGQRAIDVELPENAIDGGNDLYVKIYGGPLSQVAEGLDGVFQMPHGCFEQTSSTTYPSILALDFLERSKAVSPEVERKARDYIGQGYQRLVSFEVPGGGFSLFGKAPASAVLTAYGLLELADIARLSVPGSVDAGVLSRARDWLLAQHTEDERTAAYVAWGLAASSEPGKPLDPRIVGALDAVAKGTDDDPYALTLRANALLAAKRTADAAPLLARLSTLAIRGEDGAHWTSKLEGVLHSYGESLDVETTGLASHALALASLQPDLRAGALDWLVARRDRRGTWSTTQATIAAMRALLDEARPAPKEPQDISVLVDGALATTFKLELAARDVHRLVGLRPFATTGKHAVEVRATGASDVSYQIVGSWWSSRRETQASKLELSVAYAPSTIVAGATTACHVRVGWRGKGRADMPLVEIAVPPSFEVEADDLEALLRRGQVQRYAVEAGKITLYLESLAENAPLTFDVRLRALRPARVLAPPSNAYLYYEPEVRTETAPILVKVL